MNRFMYSLSLQTRTALTVLTLFAAALPVFGQGQQVEKPQQDPQQSIKIPTNLVTVPVIVTDRYGHFITGLTRKEFTVREEGSQQKIEDFSSTEAPFSVALLIDTPLHHRVYPARLAIIATRRVPSRHHLDASS